MQFPHLSFSGSAQDVASQTAAALSTQAKPLTSFRQTLLEERFPTTPLPTTAPLWPQLEQIHRTHTPYCTQEADAFAAALSLPTGAILGYSGLSDLFDLLHASQDNPTLLTGDQEWGCSTILIGAGYSPDIAAVQTWDLHRAVEDLSVLLTRRITGLIPWLTLTTVLGHAHFGVNAKGVCVGTNNLQDLQPRPGVVFAAAIDHTLAHAQDAQHATHILSQLPLMSGHNYIIADAHDNIVNLERTATNTVATNIAPHTAMAHTNHYLNPQLAQHGHIYSESSKPRHAYLHAYTQNPNFWTTTPTLQTWKEIFSEHNAPLCRHSDHDKGTATCGAIAFHPKQHALSILRGPVCKGTWHTYTL